MIDKLVIQIPFRYECLDYSESLDLVSTDFQKLFSYPTDPWTLTINHKVKDRYIIFKKSAKEIFINDDNSIFAEDIFCPWESLKSSHSGLALKPYIEGNGTQKCPYIEIKCSPAKLAQGHNVFGTDSVEKCVINMYTVLCQYYPEINGILNFDHARISEIDITYSSFVPNDQHRKAVIDVLSQTTKGQTKNRGDSYTTTAYFGSKKSTTKKIKVYLKGHEIEQDIKNRLKLGLSTPDKSIIELAQDLIRFELTLKTQWFKKRNINQNVKQFIKRFDNPNTQDTIAALFYEGTKDLFDSMNGEIMTITNDKEVYAHIDKAHGHIRGKTARLIGFYQSLKAIGYDNLKRQYPDSTFRRQIKDLENSGFSRSQLCSLHINNGATILQFPQIIKIECLQDFTPSNYEYPILEIA